MAVHENRHVISPVGAAGRSHFAAIVMFAGSGFDLRLAFDVHGCARDTYFGKRLVCKDQQRSRE
jgi:hypothetical protein